MHSSGVWVLVLLKRTTIGCLLFVAGVVLLGGCSEDNAGFARAPFEDIDPIAFEAFPNSVEIRRIVTEEETNTLMDGGAVCRRTEVSTFHQLEEPVFFSELRTWHSDLAASEGWELFDHTERTITWWATKSFAERQHKIRILVAKDENTLTADSEDLLADLYQISYSIGLHPDHPFCPEL